MMYIITTLPIPIPQYSRTTCVLFNNTMQKKEFPLYAIIKSPQSLNYTKTPIWAKEANVQSIHTQLVDF